ncbi:MAG: DUF4276 family protein [Desulfobacterales bacterium]|nr:DUF4276 family protein [Desulfobacterales bacterium]
MNVKIYVEGGGDQRKLKRECRRAFSKFFEKAEFKGKMPRVVACGSRNDSYADFCTAVKTSSTTELPLLLVDSEAPVQPQHQNKPWQHLKDEDGWDIPRNTMEEQAHLMVQCMETWFLANQTCLQTFFGQGFNDNALPHNPNIESVDKTQLFEGLKNATRHTQKGEYGKASHSFKILEKLNLAAVTERSPWAKRLIDKLGEVL